jgi:hypothetical protein
VSRDVGEAPVLYQRTLGATAGGMKKPKMRKEKRKEKKTRVGVDVGFMLLGLVAGWYTWDGCSRVKQWRCPKP